MTHLIFVFSLFFNILFMAFHICTITYGDNLFIQLFVFYLFIIYLSNRTHIPGFYMLVEHKESFESVLPTSKVDL